MPSIDPNRFKPPIAEQTLVNESLIPAGIGDQVSTIAGDFTTGVADSINDFDIGVTTNELIESIPDLSLPLGFNIDSALTLSGAPGANNPFGDFSLSSAPSDLSNLFAGGLEGLSGFSLNDAVGDFGLSGLFGALPISVNTNVAPPLYPEKNVLHNYATYTYRLTMGAQSLSDHIEIASDGFTSGTPKISAMMMASGGGHSVDGVTRDPIFKEDFYLEDLKMTTIIGTNAQGNGSNAVELSFVIFEPYAVSLIERLIALADKLGYSNYIDIPFIFKIEFVGYDDDGKMIGLIPETTRHVPFKLTYMKFAVDDRGSRYECTAIPVNHMAFNQTVANLPEALEVAAGTVGDFFNAKITGDKGSNTDKAGLVEVVNRYHKKLTEKTGKDAQKTVTARDFPDKIRIIVHPDIAVHRLEVANLSKVGMIKEGFAGNAHMDPTKPTFGFHAGGSITSIISTMIKNSTFYTEQIAEAARIDTINSQLGGEKPGAELPQKPFVNFKIESTYKMGEYDAKANRHAYEATFNVFPYETRGQQSGLIPRSEIENIAKEYDYLFTGKNQDIIDLDIKFDLAFYNNVATNLETKGAGTPSSNTEAVKGTDQGNGKPHQGDAITKAAVHHNPASARDNVGTGSTEDPKKMKSAAIQRSIMQDSTGDMITLDITITGDPAFIKQDNILYRTDAEVSNPKTANGSIKQDNGDMYIRLRFKTFDDIDHHTGLRVEGRQLPNSKFNRTSTFDGFYRILTLENEFTNGEFTQRLVVVRTYTQETDDIASDQLTDLTSQLTSLVSNATGDLLGVGNNALKDASNFGGGFDFNGGDFDSGSYQDYLLAEIDADSAAYQASQANNGLTPAQSVEEGKQFVGDFRGEGTPPGLSAYLPKDENLTPPPPLTSIPTVADIVELNITPARIARQR